MLSQLAQRGPDDEGVWSGEGAWLGHRRLAIIDLSPAGHQPMVSADGRWVLTLNGEIYNFESLRSELERGGPIGWRGRSDSEVLVEAIARLGIEEALRRVRGMFAFGAWDTATRTLHLARDLFGEKPLCWRLREGAFAFASTLDALENADSGRSAPSPAALRAYLRWGYVPAPDAILDGAAKLPPGGWLTWREGEAPRIRPFRSVDALVREGLSRPLLHPVHAVEELDGLLRSAIGDQRVSDAPLGAFLSGGIDSTLVTAILQSLSDRPVETFTLGFDVAEYDEARHAARIAAHLGTNHTEHIVSMADAAAIAPRMGAAFDEPFADSSQIPTFLISELAKRKVTVALTGDGGDELFAGYVRYAGIPRSWNVMRRVPLRRGLASLIRSTPLAVLDGLEAVAAPVARAFSAKGRLGPNLRRAADWLGAGSAEDLFLRTHTIWSDPERLLLDSSASATAKGAEPSGLSPLQAMLWRDTVGYLPGDILAKVDRCAMAHGLETRCPLLDPRVATFAWRAPDAWRLSPEGETKWLLRRVLDRYVPRDMIERPKMGFSVPLAEWLSGSLKGWAGDLLSPATLRRQGILDASLVERAWTRFQAGDTSLTQKVWSLLMLQAWQAARER